VDDDDVVRALGAKVVSWILSGPVALSTDNVNENVSFSTPAALSKLLHFLANSYNGSEDLYQECISRITGAAFVSSSDSLEAHTSISLIPFKSLLDAAMTEDSSLFVEERQNLYIDPAQETNRWATVIWSLSTTAFQPKIASEVAIWATEGLEHLVDVAKREVDGPLGWTSKYDVFVLGMRLLTTLKLVKHWEEQGMIEIGPEKLTERMKTWKLTAKLTAVHPLWVSIV
jgi:hypothetical protein